MSAIDYAYSKEQMKTLISSVLLTGFTFSSEGFNAEYLSGYGNGPSIEAMLKTLQPQINRYIKENGYD